MRRIHVWLVLAGLGLGNVGCVKTHGPVDRSTSPVGLQVQHVDAAGAGALVEEGAVRVLDVRTPGEFEEGHVAGATNLDFNQTDFAARLEELDRSERYLVYCRSGNRSSRSLAVFERLGFESVVHLDGGVMAWERAGGPLER